MRSTVRFDDDVIDALKERANREKVSLTKLLNRALREWLSGGSQVAKPNKRPYREKTFDMGPPRFDVTKALSLAAELEDEAIIEKLSRGQ
jgi:Ribbon-helix-helix protein, copG family